MESGSKEAKDDGSGGDSGVSESGVSVEAVSILLEAAAAVSAGSLKRRLVETRLLGETRDLLVIESFSHYAGGRTHWVCKCECGNTVVRSTATMNKNRERGRKNGCDTCVPSQRITVLNQRVPMSPEARAIAKAESRKRYEMSQRALQNKTLRREKSWYEPRERHDEIVDGAVVIGGKVVGQARTPDERAWFKRAFGE